jgi:hypothetical protein
MYTDFLFGTSSHLVMWRFLAWLMIFETNLRTRVVIIDFIGIERIRIRNGKASLID